LSVNEKLKFSDLDALDSSPHSVREKFKDHYGIEPDGIALNDETYFNAHKPPITKTWGHPCYKELGEFEFTRDSEKDPEHVVVGSNYAVNQSDEEATISVTVGGNWTDSVTWSTSTTTGLSITSEVTIKTVFKIGGTVSVSTTIGRSESKTFSKSTSSTVTVKVPPRSKKKVEMVGVLKEEKMDFKAPIRVHGMFGANFPKRTHGHYFWFLSSNSVLNKNSGEVTGTINNSKVMDVSTTVHKAEPITQEDLVTVN